MAYLGFRKVGGASRYVEGIEGERGGSLYKQWTTIKSRKQLFIDAAVVQINVSVNVDGKGH